MHPQTLVVYFSKGGATEIYAQTVAQVLSSHGHHVDVINIRGNGEMNLDRYETVVFGTAVRIGMIYRKGKRFLRREELKNKKLAIFLSSGIAVEEPETSRRRFLEPLVERYGLHPLMCDAFPGELPSDGDDLQEAMVPEVARQWAEALALRLAS